MSGLPLYDPARLELLRSTGLLDTAREEAFDRFTALVSKVLRVPVSTISLVDDHRQFFKSANGLTAPLRIAQEMPLSHSFCQYVVNSGQPLIVVDAREVELLRHNPAITDYQIIAYMGMPLTVSNGHVLGSLCAIDTQPREWTEDEIFILQTLADHVVTEINLRIALKDLHDGYLHLQLAQQHREDMSHMVVHDLRTPLTSLLAGLDFIDMLGPLNKEQRDGLDVAFSGGNVLIGLINDMLDIGKMESGAITLEKESFDVPELIVIAQHQIARLITSRRQIFTQRVPAHLPALTADSGKLCRVLVNLLGNANKFTPEGGEITVEVQVVKNGAVQFTVRDTGEGIPDEDLARVFKKFSQVESRKAGRKSSTGLGLTFCKLVVEAHGGRIWVESILGQGSAFHFIIPR